MADDGRYPAHYILVGRTPVAVDLLTWADWFEEPGNRRVALTVIDQDLGVTVSTIFLGLDHSFSAGKSEPVLFETMAFVPQDRVLLGRLYDQEEYEQRRYCTYAQAMAGHAEVVARMQAVVDELKATVTERLNQTDGVKR
jgi:hypothetical protein